MPENMVQPVVSEDLTARMATLQQQVLSQTNLQPVVDRVFPGKNSQEVGADHRRYSPEHDGRAGGDRSVAGVWQEEAGGQGTSPVPGFYVKYTASRTTRSATDLRSN